MATETYSVANDTSNSACTPGKLHEEIDADGGITTTLNHVVRDDDVITCDFVSALSAGEKTSLDAVVAAHAGDTTKSTFVTSSKLVDSEVAITEDTAWQNISGVVTTVDAFIENLSEAVGRSIGSVKTTGTGVEIRIVEIGTGAGGADRVMSPVYTPGDTSGSWEAHKFNSDQVPTAGTQEFMLQARLNGATSASVRSWSLSLLRVTSI